MLKSSQKILDWLDHPLRKMIQEIQGLRKDPEEPGKGNINLKLSERTNLWILYTTEVEKHFRKFLGVLNLMERDKVESQAKGSTYESPPTSRLQNNEYLYIKVYLYSKIYQKHEEFEGKKHNFPQKILIFLML